MKKRWLHTVTFTLSKSVPSGKGIWDEYIKNVQSLFTTHNLYYSNTVDIQIVQNPSKMTGFSGYVIIHSTRCDLTASHNQTGVDLRKSVRDDLSFMTWYIILLLLNMSPCLNFMHKLCDMFSNNTQGGCGKRGSRKYYLCPELSIADFSTLLTA